MSAMQLHMQKRWTYTDRGTKLISITGEEQTVYYLYWGDDAHTEVNTVNYFYWGNDQHTKGNTVNSCQKTSTEKVWVSSHQLIFPKPRLSSSQWEEFSSSGFIHTLSEANAITEDDPEGMPQSFVTPGRVNHNWDAVDVPFVAHWSK